MREDTNERERMMITRVSLEFASSLCGIIFSGNRKFLHGALHFAFSEP